MPSVKSLAGRLFKLVFGWYLLLAILVTCFQLGFEFLMIRSTISADMMALGQSFTPAVADAIWTYDQPLLDSLIKGIGQASIVTGAKIENNRGDVLAKVGRLPESNQPKSDNFLAPFQMYETRLWSKPLTEHQASRELGKLTLYCGRDVVLIRIKYSFMVILINSLVKTVGLWLIFYWAITWRLSKPLTKLSQTVASLNFNAEAIEPVPIDYPEQDEVGQLVASLNDMRIRLCAARRELEQKVVDLAKARDAAETANRTKGALLANMSHELHTPLNAILGFSEMMRKDAKLPEEKRKNLDIIHTSGEHLLTLVDDILEMAKIDAGRLYLQESPFDLECLVRDVVDAMHLRASEKGLQILIDPSSTFPRFIIGDHDCLHQVLINLIGNAIKFTQRGGIRVRLGTRREDLPRLWIEIEDTGPGIAPEHQQRIFEPFVQLGEHSLNQGSGLGLSITRQYLQMMGGSMQLESVPGKGTLLRIELQLKEADIAEGAVSLPGQAKTEVVGLAPHQPKYRILIIDGQPENKLLLSRLMENFGLPVETATDVESGITLTQNWRPHLIWINHRPPPINGFDVARLIRQIPGGEAIKIVAVIPSGMTARPEELHANGLDEVLVKPYRANEIYACLSKLLGLQLIYETLAPRMVSAKLTPEMLSVLPKELLRQLEDELETLDAEEIDRIVDQIGVYDQNLKSVLAKLTENFDYPGILKVLRGS